MNEPANEQPEGLVIEPYRGPMSQSDSSPYQFNPATSTFNKADSTDELEPNPEKPLHHAKVALGLSVLVAIGVKLCSGGYALYEVSTSSVIQSCLYAVGIVLAIISITLAVRALVRWRHSAQPIFTLLLSILAFAFLAADAIGVLKVVTYLGTHPNVSCAIFCWYNLSLLRYRSRNNTARSCVNH